MAVSRRDASFAARRASTAPDPEAREEVTLADLARVLYHHRVVMAIVIVLALIAGAVNTFLTPPEYEARGSVIVLDQKDIISSWLGSRQAGNYAARQLGGNLYALLYPDDWDQATGAWRGAPPSADQVALDLGDHVTVVPGSAANTLTIVVTLGDPQFARDIALAYLDSLDALRPSLENLTRSQLFDQYYDGTNSQEAQRRAETAAAEKQYWLIFDAPSTPSEPVRPRPLFNMAFATVLGAMGAMLLAFALEWSGKYRTQFRAPPR